jgi:hypothetical protein
MGPVWARAARSQRTVSDHARTPLPDAAGGRCFVVIDGAGQKLAYVYFEDEPGRRSAAKPLHCGQYREAAHYRAL